MSSTFQLAAEISDFLQDYQNYLGYKQASDEKLVAQTLSQSNQSSSKPSGPCACDGCVFQPPEPDSGF
ncbi:MAG TPA: hypothetical protein EYM95_03060 [Candidatus Obscuribacterales bacterium]|nr:hypothetical protein [Candidatus Obscuribacterales bacterium]